MDKLTRCFALHRLLDGRRTALPLTTIMEKLECSPATAKRAIQEFRERFNAPLEYDRGRGGYRYVQHDGEPRFELPGLWFGADEIAALVTLREVLVKLEPGILGEILAPLAWRLEELLSKKQLGLADASRRIRVLSQHARDPGPAFSSCARAVLSRKRLAFVYAARADGEQSERSVSPQRLTRYRGCWYLDGWCHDREALRSFAVERITEAHILADRARSVSEQDLDEHYSPAYGIFAGPATQTAVLRFTPRRARWVADESWHPKQEGRFLDDGCYELRVPFGRAEELIGDILRLGPEVEVIAPECLREETAKRLKNAATVYREWIRF